MFSKETLEINDFAGIKHIELDLRKINILIGPQATGKSVCAKLVYYFKSFTNEMLMAFENDPETSKPQFDKIFLIKFEKYFPPTNWAKKEFKIRYELHDSYIEITRQDTSKSKLQLEYSDYFRKELSNIRKDFREALNAANPDIAPLSLDRMRLFGEVKEHIDQRLRDQFGDPAGFDSYFVPAGRSFFAVMDKNIYSFLSGDKAIDPFLIEFGRFHTALKKYLSAFSKPDIDASVQEILAGKYVRAKDEDFLDTNDGRRIALANSSSGQQEILPLVAILKLFSYASYPDYGTSIFIEEPEAHIFPTAQRQIVELMAMVFNSSLKPVQYIITTHSPYILTAFNNLLEAGVLSKKLDGEKKKQLEKIVPPSKWLDPEDVRVYSLANGHAKLICCEETGLIDTNIIDDVSNDLSVQFGALLELED